MAVVHEIERLRERDPKPRKTAKQFDLLTPDQFYLSYAGRKRANDPVHRHLAALSEGDTLSLEEINQQLVLRDADGYAVAKLSKRGTEKWIPRIHQIHTVRILGMIERRKSDGDQSYSTQTGSERWEIPLCEVVFGVADQENKKEVTPPGTLPSNPDEVRSK
ncbi:MAG: hypothetical protein WD490_07230 [Opitutales bacterium]